MKAIDSQFHKIVNGASQFVIPVFQRDYSWTEEQCDQLWSDILRVGRDANAQGHFMGSLVYSAASDSAATLTRWLLIDGQQRLTTLTILLIALRRHLKESGWKGTKEDSPTANRIEAYFLKNVQEEGQRRYKLVLRRHDNTALRALLDDEDPPAGLSSRVLENYEHFRGLVADEDPEVIYRGVNRLVVVDCKLDNNDDPQLVFESLNSTGVDLSQADLIRNFILMRLPESEQTRLYETQWRHIEDLFRGETRAFDSFARDYQALQTRASRAARIDEIYYEFRNFFRSQLEAVGIEAALSDLRRYARYYASFQLGRGNVPAKVAEALTRVKKQADVAAILMMRLMDCRDRAKTLSDNDLVAACDVLESYLFRRAVCGLQTRGYSNLFASLAYQLNESSPLESLRALLHGQREGNRFPHDDEFELELQRRDIYSMRLCHYLLDRLENHATKEPTNTDEYTIEHVMPQNPKVSKDWQTMLGPDWEVVHKTWVHRLGNLTLTGYNSEYQDRSFDEKKTIKGGFNDSSVHLNKFIRVQKRWTVAEMEARGVALAKLATNVWCPLVVSDLALRTSRQDELRQRAKRRSVEQVSMTAEARLLFDAVRSRIQALDASVIEVPESHSVVYHAADGDYFVEILPRKWRLALLLNLDPGECEVRDGNVYSASETKFIVHASQAGATIYNLFDVNDMDAAMKAVRQAYELAAQ